jgi:branched-chain amino acid transport system permease protein
VEYYISTLAIYFVFYAVGAWTMNLQFGLGGIINFGAIIFEAVGAYTAALTTVGHSGLTVGETYIFGAQWPFPLPLLAGGLAGGLLAAVLGPAMMRKMRKDYQAAGTLVIAIIAAQVVAQDQGLFNGSQGLASVPQPMSQYVGGVTYQWLFFGLAVVVGFACYFVMQRLSRSPLGRSLRAVRDDEEAAAALGKNPWAIRMIVFVVGGVTLGLMGALMVEFLTAWAPSSWGYNETFDLLVAIFLGGLGNQLGALLGAFIVGVVLLQLTAFLPTIGYPGLTFSLVWVLIGLVWVAVLWFRPKGILPARPDLRLAQLGDRSRPWASVWQRVGGTGRLWEPSERLLSE